MAHKHPIYDTDKHFIIDPITKKISTESPKMVLAQHSHNSERFTFEIPKEVEGHDMSLCNAVEIHYLNIDAANKSNKSSDIYEVVDLQTGTSGDEDIVFGSWLIDGNATKYVGSLFFAICFSCIADDGTVDYCWPTLLYSSISVGETVWNTEVIASEYSNIIAQFGARIAALEKGGTGGGSVSDEQIAQAVEDYLADHPIEAPDSGGNDVLIVDLTYDSANDNYISSHKASEIKEHLNSGGFVTARVDGLYTALYEVMEEYVCFALHSPGAIIDRLYNVGEESAYYVNYKHHHDGNYVETVNGVKPDENGNVEITIPDSGGNVDGAVLYTAQALTEEQKAQARENIGAVTMDEVLAALPVGEGVKY